MRYALLLSSLAAVLVAPACKKTQPAPAAVLAGASADELAQQGLTAIKPRYETMTGPIRVAIFFSYDDLRGKRGGLFGGGDRAAPSHDATADLAARSYQAVADFVAKTFLEGASIAYERKQGAPYAVTYKGQAPSPANPSAKVEWSIYLHVDEAENLRQQLGEALSENHVTMLNGHIADPSGAEFGSNSFIRREYGGMAAAYEAKLPQSPIQGVIGVFNGCGSEQIEDLLIEATNRVSGKTLELVANRKYSAYNDFPRQIRGFLTAFAGGRTWTELIGNFTVSDQRYPSQPVYRSQTVNRL